ncbi:MAG: DNA circularization N-terminal domain-containing protein [Spirochaetaceae bacterium]|jgi:hypothetical protein|nr:DNA circularization N-terminal domain-containing protein [Spirochaetaceae bacterium]
MSWADRVLDEILLVSPSNVPLPAYWQPNKTNFSRRVAIHEIPHVNGAYIQDMGAGPRKYPITLMYAGENCDLLSKTAENLLYYEQGAWTVVHPTEGFLRLNLISCKREYDPINSGGMVILETEWVAVGLEKENSIGINKIQFIATACAALAAITIEVVTQTVKIVQRGLLNKFVSGQITKINRILDGITLSGDVKNLVNVILNESQHIDATNMETFNSLIITAGVTAQTNTEDVSAMAVCNRIKDKSIAFCKAIEEQSHIYTNLGGNFATLMVNDAVSNELYAASCIIAFAQTITTNPIQNRDECLVLIEQFNDMYNNFIYEQNIYEQKSSILELSKQYIAFSQSMIELEKLRSFVISFLLNELFNLKAVRKITLEKPSTLINIAYKYMGADAGTIDEKIATLITSNQLKGKEIILLPKGKTITIY